MKTFETKFLKKWQPSRFKSFPDFFVRDEAGHSGHGLACISAAGI
jgi:hypothetical protein